MAGSNLLLVLGIYALLATLAPTPSEGQVFNGITHRYCPRYCRGSSCWCIAQGVCATSKLSPNYSPSEDDTHVLHLNYGDGICAALRWCDRRGVCKELQQPSTSSEEEEDTNDICRQPEYKCKILEVSGRRRYCGRFRCEADLDEELEFCEECRSQRRGKCLREPGLTRCVYKKPRSRKKSEEERKREEERKKEEDRKKKEIN